MFRRKKVAKKAPPKAEDPVESNAQLTAALDTLDRSVTANIERLRESFRSTQESFDVLRKVCKFE